MIRTFLFFITVIFMVIFICSCSNPKNSDENETPKIPEKKTILSLGNSYTIGESVPEADRWPNQLASKLVSRSFSVDKPQIIARTGWTTTELLNGIANSQLNPPYDLVTLLIGVNDQYRGLGINYYRDGFLKLIDKALEFAGNDSSRVIVLSIPDYSVTPFAQSGDTSAIRKELDQFNTLSKQLSLQAGLQYVNITPISRKAREDRTYLASDNLHPSGKMYAEWVEMVLPVAEGILK